MQNKGFIKVFAILLALICLFYMSFTFVSQPYYTRADEYATAKLKAQGLDPNDNDREFSKLVSYYLNDSLKDKKVWGLPESWDSLTWLPQIFKSGYTLKEAREREINLGLDLKGGMNVIMAISVPDVLKSLSDNNTDENFNKALQLASERQRTSQKDYITLFTEEFKNLDANARLSAIFATRAKENKITSGSSDAEVIKVLRDELKVALDNSFNVLRLRIDRFGVAQPNIQQLGASGQILIELPGVKEPERVRKLLQGTANLEFWETYKLNEIYKQVMDANNAIRDYNAAQRKKADADSVNVVATQVQPDSLKATSAVDSLLAKHGAEEQQTKDLLSDRTEWEKQYPLFAVLQIDQSDQGLNSPVVGRAYVKDTVAVNKYLNLQQVKSVLPRNLMLRWTLKPKVFGEKGKSQIELYELVALKITKNDRTAALGGDVVTDARADFGGGQQSRRDSRVSVSMSMNAEGAKEWARLTRENVNRSIAIVLDEYVYSFPNVINEITGGHSSISGDFTPEEGTDLANVLQSGKMTAPARIVQEDVIGPSLGQEAINKGIVSFVIALLVLMAYLYVVYGFVPGTIANSALVVNLFFTIGILAAFHAVLTLSGIAGIVLALAIAVDANVLIHERIKEEMRGGKNVKRAVEDGYKRAFSAIFDSNISSILTGVILFYFGTGPIRGFATTLIIGILVSFFTSVFLTHVVYEYFLGKGKFQNLTFTTKISKNFLLKPEYKFIENRKLFYIIMTAILIICGAFLGVRGLNQGIDFTGGRNYVVRFDNPVDDKTETIQGMLVSEFGEGSGFNVITIGGSNQVRISTNYRIHDEDAHVDSLIEEKLYTALKPLLKDGTDKETFSSVNKQSSTKVGPSVADDIKKGAVWAIIFSVIGLGLYILLRFRDISFSVATIVTLIADAIFILGCYAIFWGILPFSMEIDQTFIGAILTALGYSINDKVVVFDRIREYTHLYPKRDKMRLFDESLNTTLNRTINTGLSTLLVLIVIFVMAGETIRSFSFAMLLGVMGALSSLFIAAPLAFEIQSRKQKKRGGEIEK